MPRSWKQRRSYQPGGALYARRQLKFSGKVVEQGQVIPAAFITSPRKHLTLWRVGHASHEPRSAFAAEPKPVATPVTAPQQPPKQRHFNQRR